LVVIVLVRGCRPRRGGFVTERAALAEYRRLCRRRDAQRPTLRLSDSVQTLCEDWLAGRLQQLQPNTVYNYSRLLHLRGPNKMIYLVSMSRCR
jgi:hypothetical protein